MSGAACSLIGVLLSVLASLLRSCSWVGGWMNASKQRGIPVCFGQSTTFQDSTGFFSAGCASKKQTSACFFSAKEVDAEVALDMLPLC